jgi:hypothetical protein
MCSSARLQGGYESLHCCTAGYVVIDRKGSKTIARRKLNSALTAFAQRLNDDLLKARLDGLQDPSLDASTPSSSSPSRTRSYRDPMKQATYDTRVSFPPSFRPSEVRRSSDLVPRPKPRRCVHVTLKQVLSETQRLGRDRSRCERQMHTYCTQKQSNGSSAIESTPQSKRKHK